MQPCEVIMLNVFEGLPGESLFFLKKIIIIIKKNMGQQEKGLPTFLYVVPILGGSNKLDKLL